MGAGELEQFLHALTEFDQPLRRHFNDYRQLAPLEQSPDAFQYLQLEAFNVHLHDHRAAWIDHLFQKLAAPDANGHAWSGSTWANVREARVLLLQVQFSLLVGITKRYVVN